MQSVVEFWEVMVYNKLYMEITVPLFIGFHIRMTSKGNFADCINGYFEFTFIFSKKF